MNRRRTPLALVALLAGCVHNLAPPRISTRPIALRALRAPPREEGSARVVIDVGDGRARVEQLTDAGHVVRPAREPMFSADEPAVVDFAVTRSRFVCRTPCVANLRQGPLRLRVSLLDSMAMTERFGPAVLQPAASAADLPGNSNTISLWLDQRPQELRIALGRRRDNFGWHALGLSMLGLGLLGTSVAVAFLPGALQPGGMTALVVDVSLLVVFGSAIIGGSVVLGTTPSVFQRAAYQLTPMTEPTR